MELTTIEQIKQIAEKEAITRYRISQKSGVSPRLLQHYWNGTNAPSITNVEKIVEAMGYEIKIVKKEEKRLFQIYETSEPVLVTKVNPKDVKEGKDYILVTKEGYILKTAPFGDISYYEIYEVEKNSD